MWYFAGGVFVGGFVGFLGASLLAAARGPEIRVVKDSDLWKEAFYDLKAFILDLMPEGKLKEMVQAHILVRLQEVYLKGGR